MENIKNIRIDINLFINSSSKEILQSAKDGGYLNTKAAKPFVQRRVLPAWLKLRKRLSFSS
jgi:hypothetical protein